ncbi:MAG TPA: hypothetical protein VMY34_05145, partial [Acidimicrobiales bacterium]|nr:hypothetical protein [Acidimicrobiales bacterium]
GCALAMRNEVPPCLAAMSAIAIGAGAPGIVYASQVYPEAPAALALAGALLLATGRRPRAPAMAAVLVIVAWLGVKYVPAAAVVAGAWMWRFRDQRRSLATFAAIATMAAIHFAWWHVRTFGGLTPYGTNVVWAGEGTSSILADHFDIVGRTYRLYGLFIDERFGLFRWLPLAMVGVLGISRRVALYAAIVLVAVLMASFASITIMGWWFPGRLLVAALPAFVVLVGLGARKVPKVAAALAVWSLAVGAAVAWSATHGGIRLAVDPFTLGFPLPPAWAFPDFRRFAWLEVTLTLLWLLAGCVALLAVHRPLRRVGHR